MLKGHVFKFQTFANEAFAHFINTFLQGNMGITKGCNLSKTNNSVTISAGYFCVMGRFLEIVGNETISNITNTGYYQLICEIDLSQTNTTSELNQASIKLVRNANAYSNLTKENLFNGGSLYQYEFARFRVTEQGIIDFVDRRTFLNLNSIYSKMQNDYRVILAQLTQELEDVEDGSAYVINSTFERNINEISDSISNIRSNMDSTNSNFTNQITNLQDSIQNLRQSMDSNNSQLRVEDARLNHEIIRLQNSITTFTQNYDSAISSINVDIARIKHELSIN